MAYSINFIVKTSLFHAYKFSPLSWQGVVTHASTNSCICIHFRRVKSTCTWARVCVATDFATFRQAAD